VNMTIRKKYIFGKVKTVAHYSLVGTKRALNSNPKLKDIIKKSIIPHLYKYEKGEYVRWLDVNFPDFIEIARLRKQVSDYKYQPLISVVVPTYNTNIEFLCDCIDSVLGQVYENWELCVVDDASTDAKVRDVIKQYAAHDPRIKYKFLNKNRHIAGATNEAIKLATGEFISLFDHDDLLWPNALFEVTKALNINKSLDFIYTDEDKITENRFEHLGPFFKPDWNPDFLHSVNYITHFTTIRKSLINEVGGFKKEYNGAQDWELFLRATRSTDKIHHIPKILYSWRIHDDSTAKSTDAKPYVIAAQRKALRDDLSAKGYTDAGVERDKNHPGYWNVVYALKGSPLISIIIPSKNQYSVLKRCIESIYSKTTYSNFEIILVDTGSTDKKVHDLYSKLEKSHDNFRLINWPETPFSYARSCNEGARRANGELLVMLNNDTEVITENWLELLAGDAQRPEIGAVGCLLFFPDKYHIQHAGVGVGLGGVAANSFQMMTLDQPMSQTQHLMINTKHNMTAVTAACMMIRKNIYDQIGGFDEEFRITYNDVDLCLRLRNIGLYNLYTPHVRLLHHESITVGLPNEKDKRDSSEMNQAVGLFKIRWNSYITHDPDININLSKNDAFYNIDFSVGSSHPYI
jgi:GT2 family glycosyltransferase